MDILESENWKAKIVLAINLAKIQLEIYNYELYKEKIINLLAVNEFDPICLKFLIDILLLLSEAKIFE